MALIGLMFSSFGQRYGDGVTDIDGNTYQTVIIGDQEWMAENLRVSKFNDGDSIIRIDTATQYDGYTWYNFDASYDSIYGKLYSYGMGRRVCPQGWHLPNIEELNTLITELGENAADKLKASGDVYWLEGNNGNNLTGFNALGAGYGYYDYRYNSSFTEIVSSLIFRGIHEFTYFDLEDNNNMNMVYLSHSKSDLEFIGSSGYELQSIRCINDLPACDTVFMDTVDIDRCEIFELPNGRVVTESGEYKDTLRTDEECDSVVTFNVSINATSEVNDTAVFIVSSSNYEGRHYGIDSIEVDTLSKINTGCDSIVTRFETFRYEENFYSDTIDVYDTTIVMDTTITEVFDTTNVYDTTIVMDTTITEVFDSITISVEDTLNITLSISTDLEELEDELKVWSDGSSIYFESSNQEGYAFELISITGSQVLDLDDTSVSNSISLNGLTEGTYIAKFTSLSDPTVSTTKKIVLR